MALAELSTNHIDIGSRINVGGKFPERDSVANQRGVPATASFLHDTPKTTGPLSVKRSRLPYPIVRISPRRYKSTLDLGQTVDTSSAPPVSDSGPCTAIRGSVMVSGEKGMSTASSIISMYDTDSQNNPRKVFRQTGDQEYRSFSMTQSSITSYTLSNRRSYSSLRDSRISGTPARPRSPFTYPTRLKRPGFRPSSPTSSDVAGTENRNTARLDRVPSFRASPSSSPYPTRRLLGYGPDLDRSVPPLLITPALSVHSRQHSRGSPPPSRMTTPALTSTPSLGLLGAPASPGARGLDRPIHHSNDYLSPPLYYDYTEAFEDEDFTLSRQTNSFPFLTIDETIPEDRPVTDDSNAVREVQGPLDRPVSTGGGYQSEPGGSQGNGVGDLIGPVAPAVDQFEKESPEDTFCTKPCGGLETDVSLDPITVNSGGSGVGVEARPEHPPPRQSNAYSFSDLNSNSGDKYASSLALAPPTQPAIHHYHSLRIQEETEIYTRLRPRRRGLYSSAAPREISLEAACGEDPPDKGTGEKGTIQTINLEGNGATLERPISSYSRRSSIRRFFSSDQGFQDLPEFVTSFEGFGRPYTPDRIFSGDARAQYGYAIKESNVRTRKLDSASVRNLDLRHSVSTADGSDVRRASSKLTKRSSKDREPKILTVVGDISGIDRIPQTHVVLRETAKRKHALSPTPQEGYQTAISRLNNPDLMKQLPRLPALRPPELVSFPLPPSAVPVELPCSNAPVYAESHTLAAAEEEPAVPAGDRSAIKIGVVDDQTGLAVLSEAPHSPLSPFPSTEHAVALGEPEKKDTTVQNPQGGGPVYKTTALLKFKVRTRFPLAACGFPKPLNNPEAGTGFQAPSSDHGLAPGGPLDTSEKAKKVSFQDTRQNQPGAHPPKFKLRSSVVSASRPHNLEKATPGSESRPRASDRHCSVRLGALLSGGITLSDRMFGRETEGTDSTGWSSTNSDNVARGRSSSAEFNPSSRRASPSEPRSVFSDDSSQVVSNRNTMKRLTNLRAKLPTLSASRRSRDGSGSFDKAVSSLAVVRSKKKDGAEPTRKTVNTCKVQHEMKRLTSRFGSWFHRRRERSRVLFRRGFGRGRKAKASASVAETGTFIPGSLSE
ncbi:hypothetical protein GP486_004607 [Trichoglossum hirsutum]|uniref:Uncharacterized protein n=1 Tax=Trichoglossum hirsutum TaxID=265104 RepID=A0A9P8LAR4_9PEZI|nr:hypothetical protein GP486_004607 [Trichoglossum hirsutum]